jgi:hypothetical protein
MEAIVFLLWIYASLINAYPLLMPNSANNAKLQHMITEFLSYADHGLLNPVYISAEEPFLFIHQRQTDALDIRERLSNVALASGLSRNVPCYTIDCDTYHLVRHDSSTRFNKSTGIWNRPPSETFAMNAGYFPWSETNNFKRHSDFVIFKVC